MREDSSMATPRHTPLQARAKETRERILAAARIELSRVGRDRLTTGDVAKRAGVSIGIVYRYFPDRVGILDEIEPLGATGVSNVRALHSRRAALDPTAEDFCGADLENYPCRTIQALDGRTNFA